MSLISIQWDIDIQAKSSIVHREEYSALGTDTFALFRREKIISPTGEVMQVPIVSGSSFRGILRRIGESLTAAVLDYEDTALPIAAAHLLTNGGRLAKSARPLTDEQERHLKALRPQVAGRIPVNVATPRWCGGWGGSWAKEPTRRDGCGETAAV